MSAIFAVKSRRRLAALTLLLLAPTTLSLASAQGARGATKPVVAPHADTSPRQGNAANAPREHSVADLRILVSANGSVSVDVGAEAALPASILTVTSEDGRTVLKSNVSALNTHARRSFGAGAVVSDSPTRLVATLSVDGRSLSSKQLVARKHSGKIFTATTNTALAADVLESDRVTGKVSPSEFARLQRVATDASTSATSLTVAAVAGSSTATGRVTYVDKGNTVRGVRFADVQLIDSIGNVYGTAQTDASGNFVVTDPSNPGTRTYYVRVSSSGPKGNVLGGGGATDKYLGTSAGKAVAAGSSVSGFTIAFGQVTDADHAFAILDALATIGGYYQTIRQTGWQTKIEVDYPSGEDRSWADGTMIHLEGGATHCGTDWCPEDAYDWDVIAHETGHIVGGQAGILDSNTGVSEHIICNGAWGTYAGKAGTYTRTKEQGLRLAWNEGWATFFGTVAIKEGGTPSGIPGTEPTSMNPFYNDETGPSHFAGGFFGYSVEQNRDTCKDSAGADIGMARGEDSELAVQRLLWDLYDTANDGDTVSRSFSSILSAVDAANATTLDVAWASLVAGQSATTSEAMARLLSNHGVAPQISKPLGGAFSPSAAPTFAWTPGGSTNSGGSTNHPNTAFTIEFRDGTTGNLLLAVGTTATSFTPTTAQWATLSAGDSLSVRVVGNEPSTPATGPWPSASVTLSNGGALRFMVVGDSISQGHEGDWTWRYRFVKHLESYGVYPNFVGPRHGTYDMYDGPVFGCLGASGQGTAAARSDGAYRDPAFDSEHDALWGRTMTDEKNVIRDIVTDYRPTHLFVELGINDLLWGIASPSALVTNLKTLVAETRAANPTATIYVANVTNRTPLAQVPNAAAIIAEYNAALPATVAGLTTTSSPVHLVDINSGYDPAVDTYDGLHPNGVGEYKIASKFGNALFQKSGIGGTFAAIPATVPELPVAAPAWVTPSPIPSGIWLSWARVYGATGYFISMRDATTGQAFTELPLAVPDDHWTIGQTLTGHRYEFTVRAVRGDRSAPSSQVVGATASPQTPNTPTVTATRPDASGIDLAWTAPTVGAPIDRYRIYVQDLTAGQTIATCAESTGTSYRVPSVVRGHRYNIAVAAVNWAGEGLWGAADPVIGGYGAPAAPVQAVPKQVSATEATVSWGAVAGASEYYVWQRHIPSNGSWSKLPLPITGTSVKAGLLTNPWNYEFYVVAANGSLLSPASNILRVQGLALATPTITSAVAGNRQVQLAWGPIANSDGTYWIYQRDVTAGATTFTKLPFPVTGTSFTAGALSNAHTWEFKVSAIQGVATSPLSAAVSRKPVLPPSNLTSVTGGKNQAILKWTAVQYATGYYIYQRDATANTAWQRLPIAVGGTQFTAGLLTGGHTWQFKIRATDGPGSESVDSNIRSAAIS